MLKLLVRFHRHTVLIFMNALTRRVGERGVLMLLAALIGFLGAIAALLLHFFVDLLSVSGERLKSLDAGAAGPLLYAILPMTGIGLSALCQTFWGGARYAKSLSPLILSLHRHRTAIPWRETVNHIVSSAFSVGLGGSAGLEAPSVLTGAAIGANAATFLGVQRQRRNLLVGCGAAAAISAIFGSPIGGVLFAVEVLLPEFRVGALVPMLIASAVATVVNRLLPGGDRVLFLAVNKPWLTNAVPFYFLCGLFSAVVGVYVIRTASKVGVFLKKRLVELPVRVFVGGGLLCLILYVLPLLRGQGYQYITMLFRGEITAIADSSPLLVKFGGQWTALTLVVLAALLLKVVTASLTVDSGGDGGIFAPTLFIGAFAGFAFARLINLTGIITLQENNFIVVGMAGVFTAVMRAPLTGIFLVAEVTGGYVLLVPLMIVSATSHLLALKLERSSIYYKPLVDNHLICDNDKDRSVLQQIPVRLNLIHNYVALKPGDTIAHLNDLVEEFHYEIFPVLDEKNHLLGIIRVAKVLNTVTNPLLFNTVLVYDMMEKPRCTLSIDDDLSWVMVNFERYQTDYLPVNYPDGLFAGFVSQNACFQKYRRLVRENPADF